MHYICIIRVLDGGRWVLVGRGNGDSAVELKKYGDHCGAKEKVGGATQMSILHGVFRCFEESCYDLLYQVQHRLMNIVKYELAFLFTRDAQTPL